MKVILAHGSVETSCEPQYLTALQQAALIGSYQSAAGLLDAVETTVIRLEDDPLFNAGYGSVLNHDGEVELDAAIIDGATGRCGAVAALQRVRNPVSVARQVLEKTPHVLLAGNGALRFARNMGFADYNPVAPLQQAAWERAKRELYAGREPDYSLFTGLPKACDTVGCVALDNDRLAAASSTGGSFLKLPGRVGDTGVIGGGIYANRLGAVVCTGLGEAFIRKHIAGWVIDRLEQGHSVKETARAAIAQITEQGAAGGILVLDRHGSYAACHNATSFPVALAIDGVIVENFTPERL